MVEKATKKAGNWRRGNDSSVTCCINVMVHPSNWDFASKMCLLVKYWRRNFRRRWYVI